MQPVCVAPVCPVSESVALVSLRNSESLQPIVLASPSRCLLASELPPRTKRHHISTSSGCGETTEPSLTIAQILPFAQSPLKRGYSHRPLGARCSKKSLVLAHSRTRAHSATHQNQQQPSAGGENYTQRQERSPRCQRTAIKATSHGQRHNP